MNIYFGSIASPANSSYGISGRTPKHMVNPAQTASFSNATAAGSQFSPGQVLVEPDEGAQSPVNVSLRRVDTSSPWGFRVQGGIDYKLQLTVCKTQSGSSAEGVLHRGDAILDINGESARNMCHKEATEKIRCSGTELHLMVSRRMKEDLSDLRPQGQLKFSAPQYGRR
ncbi:unnamed protein product [Dicrocoelium dendriticum]|nr:unnamed protein product [Dicrocoelium dendriticum]